MAGSLPFSIPGLTSGVSPSPTVGLDSGAQGLLNSGTAAAEQSPDQYAANDEQGMSAYANSLSGSGGSAAQQGAATGQDPAFLQAARNVYGTKTAQNIAGQKERIGLGAAQQQGQVLSQYAKAALGQQQALTQQYSALTNAYNQQETARAQMVNSIFQTADVAIGQQAARKKEKGGIQTPETTAGGDDLSGAGSMA